MLFFTSFWKLIFFIPLAASILDDDILYDIHWQADSFLAQDYENRLDVISKRKETFSCSLPTPRQTFSQKENTVRFDDVNEFLKSLHAKKSCTYRFDPFWSYEFCHGRHIRQYHETKVSGKKVIGQQYFLGSYNEDHQEMFVDSENNRVFKIDHKQLNERSVPMLAIRYTDGTKCDINSNKPRETVIFYVCQDGTNDGIIHFHEVSSCFYEMIVGAPTLCKISAFSPAQVDRYSIICSPQENALVKPRNLKKLEKQRQESMKSGGGAQFSMTSGDGSTFIISYDFVDEPPTEDGRQKVKVELKKEESRTTPKPIVDEKFLDEFFSGRQCLKGGTGWWRYELCYGKHVIQFHDEGEKRTSILLGTWNLDKHIEWSKNKAKTKINPNRPFISLFYGGGDLCPSTNQPRTVEVKLRCSKQENSPDSPSMYLVEPETCSYILGVESPKFCSLNNFLDEQNIPNTDKIVKQVEYQ